MKKPSKAKITIFIIKAFGEQHAETILKYGMEKWINRFKSPVNVWSYSDFERRATLRKMFPQKFKGLDKYTNLNNQEYQIDKYQKW